MPIDAAWMNDNQDIIVRTYHGRWTPDDLNDSDETISAMVDTVNHRVDIIADMRNSTSFPPNVGGMFDSYHSKRHPRIGLVVVVGREINYELMALLAQRYPDFLRYYAFASSLEDAEQTI